MTGIDLDRETTTAAEILARRMRDRDPDTDVDLFAREFMLTLLGRGWRMTEAGASPGWRMQGHGTAPTNDYRAALAEVRAKAERDAKRLGHHAGEMPVLRDDGAA